MTHGGDAHHDGDGDHAVGSLLGIGQVGIQLRVEAVQLQLGKQ